MERLKVAVVGVGALGRHHARILSQNSEIELVGVADPNEAQGKSVAESCGRGYFLADSSISWTLGPSVSG